jgi:hypothetical protein
MKSAEVYVRRDFRNQDLDWFTLNFVPSIDVPRDAWIDWDAVGERFITAESCILKA